jgi:glycosyltransferase involved in cell wall biosynthesis
VAEYLPECVSTLLEQACRDFEIILVDDGSTDGSGMLCDGYRMAYPERIRVIHRKNGGLGAARNTGLEVARGDYVLFVDSDDLLEKDALACLSRAVDETGADMYTFGFSYLYGVRRVPGEPSPLEGEPPFDLRRRPELLLQTPSACLRLWKRELFDDPAVRFPGRVWYEDLRTVPKALISCKSIVVLPNRLYVYRQREGSIMHNPNLRRNLEILEALEDLRQFFTERDLMRRYGGWLSVLAVENVCLASQRVLMSDTKASFLPDFVRYLDRAFPGYDTNPLLDRLGKKKKLVLRLLQKRRYGLLRGIFELRRHMRRG